MPRHRLICSPSHEEVQHHRFSRLFELADSARSALLPQRVLPPEAKDRAAAPDRGRDAMTVAEEGSKPVIRNDVSRLNVAPFDSEVINYCIGALRSHGCVIAISSDRYTVFFPQGTIQEQGFPILIQQARAGEKSLKSLVEMGIEKGSLTRDIANAQPIQQAQDGAIET